MRSAMTAAMVVALAGCTTVSSVKPQSREHYLVVSGTANPFATWSGIMGAARDSASVYCDDRGKQAHQVTIEVDGVRGFSRRHAYLQFECEPKWITPDGVGN
jgi:putative hemolysin